METVFLVLLLVAAVVLANAIYARFNIVPVAFLQIGAGLVLSFVPLYKNFELEPELFLFAIISMLMFNDGQNTNIRRLMHQMGTTLSLSVVLAIITILVVGSVTHVLIPQFSLALALALGAIITPTDAVAVSSITSKVLVPKEAMNTLENESLFNDASGIVAFNLAIASIVTGKFSVVSGVESFMYVFIGGILVGLVMGYIIVAIRIMLINMRVDTPSVIVPYTLLTPFAVYLIAESIDVSGILAVVATGLIHGLQQDRLRLTTSRLQIVMGTTWSIISSILNGIVFVLLGLSLPEVIQNLQQRDTGSIAILVGLGFVLYIMMTLLRFIWTQFDFAKIRAWNFHDKIMNSLVMALSGVHGTITLAMAFSLPLTIKGQPFAYRNDIIFVAAVVILISLIVPTLVLPFILPKKVSVVDGDDLSRAKSEMVRDAVKMVQHQYGDSLESGEIIRIIGSQRTVEKRPNKSVMSNLFDETFKIEKAVIEDMLSKGEITIQEFNLYMMMLRKTIIDHSNGFRKQMIFIIRFTVIAKISLSKSARKRRREIRKIKKRKRSSSREDATERNYQWGRMRSIEAVPYKKVMLYLTSVMTEKNEVEVELVRRSFDQRHRRLSGSRASQANQNELLVTVFQHEHNFVQSKVSSEEYSHELGNELYQQISTDQLVSFQTFD
ncbi:sodium:proton antiporter [Companilactobacillus allii]|uniref:Na+/H+ antiporter n=1 Tax=Companilactobacillus allii TaxID=1847728 RepID=A0A1P8Q3J8_9LACO|nr:sodium:proton antiporter [Companilactobacillus allii]APX72435.1 Na+/H+ antiporter [Companilactobacillus allii]USQ69530.1 sodium:proton antiporter [Companilactobacillus allii]